MLSRSKRLQKGLSLLGTLGAGAGGAQSGASWLHQAQGEQAAWGRRVHGFPVSGEDARMATTDQKSPKVLLLHLCRWILGKSNANVAQQLQYAMRVAGSNFSPTLRGISRSWKKSRKLTKKRSRCCIVFRTPRKTSFTGSFEKINGKFSTSC